MCFHSDNLQKNFKVLNYGVRTACPTPYGTNKYLIEKILSDAYKQRKAKFASCITVYVK